FGFPEVFAGLPPAPAGPVDPPSNRQVRRAMEASGPGTLRVVGRACDRIQNGSGFVVDPNHVVTNAHVVAGVTDPQVQQQGGDSFAATTVLFDPDLDLAVLRMEAAPADPLPMVEAALARRDRGAVLGYPGGGPLRARAAAVRRVMTAVGRDIYGRGTVRREVYELQTRVRPGNSGGPFVDLDGRVAGVVFAASTTEEDVGYALTAAQVRPRIDRALGRTDPVGTGPCIR
ncbi:MAG: MarP family serine protease, partial [Actinomycetota bacterium]|nr:MarP family serine protease [Actinomycetota bacterium]